MKQGNDNKKIQKPDWDFGVERHWQPWLNYQGVEIPASRAIDLRDERSLTQRLIKKSQGDFKVEVLSHGWDIPSDSECRSIEAGLASLPLAASHVSAQQAIIREVELICQGQVWVIARSIIPKAILSGELAFIEHLGEQPLGEVLFNDPALKRTSFEICHLEEHVWGRRSVFLVQNQPLLVAEIFLANCPSLQGA